MMMQKLKKIKFYPLLIAIYPVLALRAQNLVYVNYAAMTRALVITLATVILLWLILKLIMRDWDKAGIVASLGLLLFFTYGQVYLYVNSLLETPIRHRYLMVIFAVVFLTASWLVVFKLKKPKEAAQFLTVVGIVLVGYAVVQFLIHDYSVYRASVEAAENREEINGEKADTAQLPDIYLIILDAHTRSDVLLKDYEYDNSAFIEELEALGFYVADCAQSNYPGTNFSLTSLLNMNYFHNIFEEPTVLPPLKSSAVAQVLEAYGYITVAFENRATGHFDLFEDVHLSRNPTVLENMDVMSGINEFESMLIETSFLRTLIDMQYALPDWFSGDVKDAEFYEHYLQVYFILDELPNLPEMEGPKFVLAHILTPHDPYVFAPNGDYLFTGAQGDIVGYRNNVQFIDNHLHAVLKQIIEKSEIPPVIILMGDHGPSGDAVTPEQRMKILNAYYISEEAQAALHETITPVNSFRVIFNYYFGGDYELLEDHSYFMWGNKQWFDLSLEIPNQCGVGE